MVHAVNRRFTAEADEPFIVFLIGMWLPLHKDVEAVARGMTRAKFTGSSHSIPAV